MQRNRRGASASSFPGTRSPKLQLISPRYHTNMRQFGTISREQDMTTLVISGVNRRNTTVDADDATKLAAEGSMLLLPLLLCSSKEGTALDCSCRVPNCSSTSFSKACTHTPAHCSHTPVHPQPQATAILSLHL